MNRNLQNFMIGVGSVIDLFPSSTDFDHPILKLRTPPKPLSAAEAAEFNAAAIHSDWQHVGDALRRAATSVTHDHT